jgi:hypothetical protein
MKVHVMSLCTGYSYDIFERFAGSLYDTGFSGNLYFFIRDIDVPIIKKLKEKYPNLVGVQCDLTRFGTHIQSSRFKFMFDFLQKNELEYDYLFLCDSRDVLFQKNIEDFPLKGDLYAFEEEQIISRCKFNSRWIRDVEQVIQRSLDFLVNKPIICSGTFFVSKQMSLKFLNDFSNFLLHSRCSRNCGVDQGVYNFFCYENPLRLNIQFLSNSDNLVNTVGYGHKEIIGSKIVNSKKEVSYIVHQYDRMSQEERKQISTKYNFCL